MPTTPGCHPSLAAQTNGASKPRASAWARAASRTWFSTSLRSLFRASIVGLVPVPQTVCAGQKACAQIGLTDAPACVDARAQNEP